jgi:malate dehydrogenase (oxaloacetate-decarboxylating)(NADP+)
VSNKKSPFTHLNDLPRGVDILHNPILNKGTAFSLKERQVLGLKGLLPPHVLTQDEQKVKVLSAFRGKQSDLEKYIYLLALQDRNEYLFYRLIIDEIEEMMPIIYTPTVGKACQEFAHIYRRPRGIYISSNDQGSIKQILSNWIYKDLDVIVVTDGERILGLGDLGADGMGIPIGKLSLYTACGGIDPARTLPITIDVGTNNKELLAEPLYIGLRQNRLRGEEYDALIDEFMEAVTEQFPDVLIQFEDFANQNAKRLLEKYRNDYCMFNDDIQGTGSVTLAGLLSAMRLLKTQLKDQKILFYGAGSAAFGIAEMIVQKMMQSGLSIEKARKQIYFFDSKGLVVKSRNNLNELKLLYAHSFEENSDFLSAVKVAQPSILIGVSGQGGAFTEPLIREMGRVNSHPIIFALSNPTSKSECTAEQAYNWTGGRAIFASGSPFDPVQIENKKFYPGQGNNAYIFPGVGLGVVVSKSSLITDEMFIVAADTLANMVTEKDLKKGRMYPSITKICDISYKIAIKVANIAFDKNIARIPTPENLEETVRDTMFSPEYPVYI